ncbi:unnamed protein product [Cunninghamella blakesleeana]
MKITSFFIIASSFLFGLSIAVSIQPRVFGGCTYFTYKAIYSLGGRSSNKNDSIIYKDIHSLALINATAEEYELDELSNCWRDLISIEAEMPFPNSDFILIPVGFNAVTMVGGSRSINNSSSPFLWDPESSMTHWKPVSLSNLSTPLPLLRGSAFALDGRKVGLIAGGSIYSSASSFLPVYYDSNMSILIGLTKIGDMNTNRIGHSMMYQNNTLYIIGGQESINNQLRSVPMDQMDQFDTLHSTWTTVKCNGTIPTPRSHFTLSKSGHDNPAYSYVLFGGINADTNVASNDTLYMLYVNTGTYESLNTINGPSPRYGHSAVKHSVRELFIMNGMDANEVALGDLHLNDIRNNQWVDKFSVYENYLDSPYKKNVVAKIHPESHTLSWCFIISVILFIQLTVF